MNESEEEKQHSYGIEWDVENPDPACIRIGASYLHRELPVQSKMRGCLLDDNGNVTQYLPSNDWTAVNRSGAIGQVMVEIPEHWRKFETDGTKRRVKISEVALPGYSRVPMAYISAYEASLQRSANKLASVINSGTDFRGGNDNADWDGTYRSLLGRPVSNKNRVDLRTAARNRNGAATAEWNILDYNVYKSVVWLYLVEYANRNCQLPFNSEKDADGFAQGGLGDGVTDISNWGPHNVWMPFVPCGHTDALGNGTGEVAYEAPNADGGIWAIVMVPRYRGVENIFGHIPDIADGVIVDVKSDADGGTSRVFISENPANYNDTDTIQYEMRGNAVRGEYFTKDIIGGDKGDLMALTLGGTSTTYWCDWGGSASAAATTRILRLDIGGSAQAGALCGLTWMGMFYEPSDTSEAGTHLCFVPQE